MSQANQGATLLLVDDTPSNLDVLCGILAPFYRLKLANSGERALAIVAGASKPDLILLDISMPDMDGYEVCRRLKADAATKDIPVIFCTARTDIEDEAEGFRCGGVDYLMKPVAEPLVLARVATHVELHRHRMQLDALVRERTAELNETRLQVIRRLGRAAEYKDDETGLHVIRMSHYARLLALAAGYGEAEADCLFNAAPMHDIGKIGIPDAILQKPGKLTAAEFTVMKEHPKIGARIIGSHDNELLKTARLVALSHHEKWDGSGYPYGLKGSEIPLVGRIVAIADVFDALTSARPYKEAWTVEEAEQYLSDQSGKHFDPLLVELFLERLPEVIAIRDRYSAREAEAA